jgi:hydroxymethylpyrimidine/phosphomethylpyrimidine kinase
MARMSRVLTIAGSDSGGGAGVQADLKAFAYCGVYGTCAITAVTAQNTLGVVAIHELPAEIVRAQIEAVVQDIGVDAVKIGMLGAVATVEVVAQALDELVDASIPVVVDPVMSASTGMSLLDHEALDSLIARLLPRASVITPNVPEARTLLAHAGIDAATNDAELARSLLELGPRSVVLTGGHRETPGDIYCDAAQLVELEGTRYRGGATHGSGCTHSAILAAELAKGATALEAAETAARLTAEAIRNGLEEVGGGAGPVNLFGSAGP